MSNKIHTLIISHTKRPDREEKGTLEELTKFFNYTLQIANSHNASVKTEPKSIKSLVSNLQKAYSIKEGRCYDRTFVELKMDTAAKAG